MKKVMILSLLVGILSLSTVIEVQSLNKVYITGIVSGSSMRPVPSVWVILSKNDAQCGKFLTGDDGRYYIGNLARGTYMLVVKKGKRILFQKQVSLPKDRICDIKLP